MKSDKNFDLCKKLKQLSDLALEISAHISLQSEPLTPKKNLEIPEPGTRSRQRSGIVKHLRALGVGESFKWDISAEVNVRRYAKNLGMTVTTRRLGETGQITIYRVS